MTSSASFENNFEEYSPTKVSDTFNMKVNQFLTTKLQELKTKVENDICNDGTVYTGSCGLALYYCLHSLRQNNVNYAYLKCALQFTNLNQLKGRKISFLCGDAGPIAIATVISFKMGTRKPDSIPDYKILIQRLLRLDVRLNDSPDEILYGKAGYLYALLFVNKFVTGENAVPASHMEKVCDSIIDSGKNFKHPMKSKCPLMWEWHDKVYLGAAHGMAGILYMLLQARKFISDHKMQSWIKPTIDWLLSLQFSSGNFPSSLNSSSGDRLVQWCHGAPGFVPLCLLAFQIFKDDHYLSIAVKCGDVVWERGLCRKGYSLCHGVGGNAYAFIQLYQVTKDPVHAYRACCFVEWCTLERPGSEKRAPDRPTSLFEGLLGRLFLAEDFMNITEAKFPAFTL